MRCASYGVFCRVVEYVRGLGVKDCSKDPNLRSVAELQEFLRQQCAHTKCLAAYVKNLQKASPEGNAEWQAYCWDVKGGTCDPAKHDAGSLQAFIDSRATFYV